MQNHRRKELVLTAWKRQALKHLFEGNKRRQFNILF